MNRRTVCDFTSSSVPALTARTRIFHSSTINFTRFAPAPADALPKHRIASLLIAIARLCLEALAERSVHLH
jgi:hypothetical protein